ARPRRGSGIVTDRLMHGDPRCTGKRNAPGRNAPPRSVRALPPKGAQSVAWGGPARLTSCASRRRSGRLLGLRRAILEEPQHAIAEAEEEKDEADAVGRAIVEDRPEAQAQAD